MGALVFKGEWGEGREEKGGGERRVENIQKRRRKEMPVMKDRY